MEREDRLAITEVYYIISNLSIRNRRKIPTELYKFFEDNYSEEIYQDLNINNDNIENISYNGKLLLKMVECYLV